MSSRAYTDLLHYLANPDYGQVFTFIGEKGPFYSGLFRNPAEYLLEAVLTLFDHTKYDNILLATGMGSHLPTLKLKSRATTQSRSSLWFYKGGVHDQAELSPDEEAPSEQDEGLLDTDDIQSFLHQGTSDSKIQVLSVFDEVAPWADTIERLIQQLFSACGHDFIDSNTIEKKNNHNKKSLVIIDDNYIHYKFSNIAKKEIFPTSTQKSNIEISFSKLLNTIHETKLCDIVFLCHSKISEELLNSCDRSGLAHAQIVLKKEDMSEQQRLIFESQNIQTEEQLPVLKLDDESNKIFSFDLGSLKLKMSEFYPGLENSLPLNIIKEKKPSFPKSPLDELNKLVGLEEVKENAIKIQNWVILEKERARRSGKSINYKKIKLNTAFYGPPGTGKTTVMKIISKMYFDLGLLPTDKFECVHSNDLIPGHVRGAAPATAKKCDELLGGCLAIDEAYLLYKKDAGLDYGEEVSGTLLSYLNGDKGPIAIFFAGYNKELKDFIFNNKGFPRRIGFHIHFKDYSDKEILKILLIMSTNNEEEIDENAHFEILKKVKAARELYDKDPDPDVEFPNGGLAELILQHAVFIRDERVIDHIDNPDVNLNLITKEDINKIPLDKIVVRKET